LNGVSEKDIEDDKFRKRYENLMAKFEEITAREAEKQGVDSRKPAKPSSKSTNDSPTLASSSKQTVLDKEKSSKVASSQKPRLPAITTTQYVKPNSVTQASGSNHKMCAEQPPHSKEEPKTRPTVSPKQQPPAAQKEETRQDDDSDSDSDSDDDLTDGEEYRRKYVKAPNELLEEVCFYFSSKIIIIEQKQRRN
jgi:hypothetical protein